MKMKNNPASVSTLALATEKKFGVWGIGIIGMSVLNFLLKHPLAALSCMDKKLPTLAQQQFFAQHNITYYAQEQLHEFFANHDYVIISAGIDRKEYQQYQHKFIEEIDLFAQHCTKPIIAITGTVGKTSVTHLLTQLLTQCGKKVLAGGNIGVGMLDLLEHQNDAEYIILELSSFQLEYATQFIPFIALWTNLYPNHLDRHKTIYEYCAAKYRLIAQQQAQHYTILHQEVLAILQNYNFALPQSKLIVYNPSDQQKYLNVPDSTFMSNWAMILETATIVGIDMRKALEVAHTLTIPEHRIEKVATVNNVDFYNDSKATIVESTLAAINKLNTKPTHIILGGLSKGVDRSILFKALPAHIKSIVCFGAEAQQLAEYAQKVGFALYKTPTLEEAFAYTVKNAVAGEQVLFSPSGSSYDLFAHYQERGDRFKHLVQKYAEKVK